MGMKASLIVMVVLLAASLATAQKYPNPAPASGVQGAPQGQGSSPQPAPSGGQAQPPASGSRVLQAKSQEELKAYQDAAAITDPAQMAAAADAFAAKYPDSELKGTLFVRAMTLYGQANNGEKIIETGRKAIAADPINPVPLVQVGSVLAETTRDTDLDREQRLNEAGKDAQAAIDNIDKGLIVPPNAPADKVAAAKTNILIMAYDTLGMVNLNKKDFASAEQSLLKAADLGKANPEAVIYLRLSVAQDQLKKYPQALDSANKALQYAPQGSTAQNLAKQQQLRVQKLLDAESSSRQAAPGAATPAPAKPATQPSTDQPSGATPPPVPH